MGKRKSVRPPPRKQVVDKLDTEFTCPFCNHPKSVYCILDHKNQLGTATCRICSKAFRTAIHSLSAEIDVYSDWIDACERVNDGVPQPIDEAPGPAKKQKICKKKKSR